MALKAGPRMLLGIDYGTTYTGLAWAQQQDGSTSISDPPGIRVFKDWPEKVSPKVPSQVSWSKTSNSKKQWGFSIDDNSKVFQWTKLELLPQSPVKELECFRNLLMGQQFLKDLQLHRGSLTERPKYLTRTASDIIGDFLAKVARWWHEKVTMTMEVVFEDIHLDIVVTHPASWGYDAINATMRAVRYAFPSGMFPKVRDFYIVSEPEASALFAVNDMLAKEHHGLFTGECFLLLDAGGGTVDIVTYRVESLKPLRLRMIGEVDGAQCGAIFVDASFLQWLEPKLRQDGGQQVRLISQQITSGGHSVFGNLERRLLSEFEPLKHGFDRLDRGVVQMGKNYKDSKRKDHKLEVHEDFAKVIVDGVVGLSSDDLQRLFDNCIKKIIQMIDQKVDVVENKRIDGVRLRLSNIFLSGGFSENPYLRKKVKEYGDSVNITVQPADECWTAVVQGAVLKAMGVGSEVAKRVAICPSHYGVCLSETYEEWNDYAAEAQRDRFQNRQMVSGQITWLVKKGDIIMPDSPIKQSLSFQAHLTKSEHRRGFSLKATFVATSAADAPSNISELDLGRDEVANVMMDLSAIDRDHYQTHRKTTGWGSYLTIDLVAEIQVSNTVSFIIKRGDAVMKTCSMKLYNTTSSQGSSLSSDSSTSSGGFPGSGDRRSTRGAPPLRSGSFLASRYPRPNPSESLRYV